MYRDARIGVVIPAYNEERFVGEVIDGIPDFVDGVYVVDDCSNDGTWTEILAHIPITAIALPVSRAGQRIGTEIELADSTQFRPVRYEANRGRGAAVKTGYRLALEDGMDVVAVMDGDGQMDPDILDRIIDPVVRGEVDYAQGNRLIDRDHWALMSRFRLFGNLVLTGMMKVASGYWHIRDPQNGYTAISAAALEAIDLESLYPRYGFLNDLLIELSVHDMTVANVPMAAIYGNEESHIDYYEFVPTLLVLMSRGFVYRIRRRYFDRG